MGGLVGRWVRQTEIDHTLFIINQVKPRVCAANICVFIVLPAHTRILSYLLYDLQMFKYTERKRKHDRFSTPQIISILRDSNYAHVNNT